MYCDLLIFALIFPNFVHVITASGLLIIQIINAYLIYILNVAERCQGHFLHVSFS